MASADDPSHLGGSDARTVVAAFDFDHTLTNRDSVVPFLVLIAGRGRLALGLLRHAPAVVGALVRRDRDRMRAVATTVVFTGRSAAEVQRRGEEFARARLWPALRADTVDRLRHHLAAGHRVVIVSASYGEYLDPIAARLGVHAVLSSRLEVADGRCTGALSGANCRGAEKARRLEEWLAREGLARTAVEVHAYGDSAGDRELLAGADHPTWITQTPIASAPAGPPR